MNEPTVDDVYDSAVEHIKKLREEWDEERVRYPERYGPVPKSVWLRVKRRRAAAKYAAAEVGE